MEIKVPEVGESVHEALLAKWFKKEGDTVGKDEALCELETDKITLDLHADAAGVLSIKVPEGTTVKIGTVIGTIDEIGKAAEPAAATSAPETKPAEEVPQPEPAVAKANGTVASSPAARLEMRKEGIDPDSVQGTGKGGRITLDDLFSRIQESSRMPPRQVTAPPPEASASTPSAPEAEPPVAEPVSRVASPDAASVRSEAPPVYAAAREERVAMTPIRRRIAERLLSARQQTAMLTTFNEADMTRVKTLRADYREHFRQRHGQPLGLIPFFVRACIEALREFPAVNASIDGNDMVYHHYYDIGIAIGGEKGLVVPVLRNADQMRMYEVDQAIAGFVDKINTNRLAISDLEGGTFTISNGGIYGSMLSTPILNPPQSGVLGMHAIQDRPVVRDGQVVIRPMMYLALSYDHRLIDGREAVGFLKKVKEYIEAPEELLLEG